MTLAEYMAIVLTDPADGYYTTHDPLGSSGDFVTAPEISQMFGELIGVWCADCWRALASPSPVRLVELGPGRGTLMADALRALRVVPEFLAALRLHLVEVSPTLRACQEAALAAAPLAEPPVWHDGFDAVPDGPLLLIANEFFDALPIRQFEKAPGGWCERLVTLDAQGELTFALSAPSGTVDLLVPALLRDGPVGTLAEVSTAAMSLAAAIAARLARHGGAALVIDYGAHEPNGRPTLQALRQHRPSAVLAEPGLADLTAHVDFGALAEAARNAGAAVYGPLSQGAFLESLGIAARAEALTKKATNRQASDIAAAVARLTAPDRMGEHFQVLAITGAHDRPPVGLAAEGMARS